MEDDNISHASFNSSMFNQFKDLDSISQIGTNEFDESAVDFGAIKFAL